MPSKARKPVRGPDGKKISPYLVVKLTSAPRLLRSLEQAMTPEILNGKRSEMKLRKEKNGRVLVLEINSNDIVSLRASMNTNLRLISAAIKTINVSSEGNDSPR